jgi:hypothetical protein
MKFIAVILAFIVLGLSVMPCNDIHGNTEMQKTEISGNSNDNHQNDIDYCSPFCSCNCCSHSVFVNAIFLDFNFFFYTTANYSNFDSHIISPLSISIWQPPKMS